MVELWLESCQLGIWPSKHIHQEAQLFVKISAIDRWVLHFNALAGINFTSPDAGMIFLPDAENLHDCIFIRLDRTPERDGRTDGWTDRIAVAVTAFCIVKIVCCLHTEVCPHVCYDDICYKAT